jgi:DNA-binding NarL/FixJ family response regulator
VVEQARSLVGDIRTILILDGPSQDLVAAGRSFADAVVLEADCIGPDQPLVRALAMGQRYRSPSVLAAMDAASVRDPWRDQSPGLSFRDLEIVDLLVQGLTDRQIGERLRRKLGASSRTRVVAKAVQLGLARLGAG